MAFRRRASSDLRTRDPLGVDSVAASHSPEAILARLARPGGGDSRVSAAVAATAGAPRLLTATDVGRILGVSARTVRRLPIPSIPVGRLRRYREEAVRRWIEAREVNE